MGIRNMFDHKYPITNLHEIDLTFMHDDIDKMIAILEEWEQIIDELKAGIELFKDLEARVLVLEADVSSLKTELIQLRTNYIKLNSDVNSIKTNVNYLVSRVKILQTEIDGLKTYIDNRINYVVNKSYQDDLIIMNKLNQAKAQLQSQIDDLYRLISSISTEIINPWHGLDKMSLEENNKLIYSDLADRVPLSSEYNTLGLTADEYKAYDLTALDYAKFGFNKLHLDWVFSPAYGFKQEISNVLTSIINFIQGTLSADEYAALDLSADDYAALDITAAEYYSYSN